MKKETKSQTDGPTVKSVPIDEETLKSLREGYDWSSPEKKEAINMLILGCRKGQENGIFELEEARILMNAIDLVNPPKNNSK